MIGPGPGTPHELKDVKLSKAIYEECRKLNIPVLGVCLGHQLMALEEGSNVVLAQEPMHGRHSLVCNETFESHLKNF